MNKKAVLSLLISALVISVIGYSSYAVLIRVNTDSKADISYHQGALNLSIALQNDWNYLSDPLNVTVRLHNTNTTNLTVNILDDNNVYFELDLGSRNWDFVIDDVLSRNGSTVNNTHWEPGGTITLPPNAEVNMTIDLKSVWFYVTNFQGEREWMTLQSYLNSSPIFFEYNGYCNVTAHYVPTENLSMTEDSNTEHSRFSWKPHYEKIINREYGSKTEENALITAEFINYTQLYNITRFSDMWANYIDNQTVGHYGGLVDAAVSAKRLTYIVSNYTASVHSCGNFSIANSSGKIYLYGDGVQLLESDSCYDRPLIYLSNASCNKTGDFRVDFGSGTICNMSIAFIDAWGMLAAYYVYIHQYVILDEKNGIYAILLWPSPHVVS